MSTFSVAPLPAPDPRTGALERTGDARAVQVGILATVLVHVLLFLFGPRALQNEFSGVPAVEQPKSAFDIVLAPDPAEETAKKEPFRFVETNPDKPENVPDQTENFAARNQQSAQEKATPDAKGDRPAMEGQKEIQSTQLVDGRLVEEVRLVPAAPPPTPQVQQGDSSPAARQAQDPLAGSLKLQGDNPDGFGTNVARNPVNPQPIEQRIEGVPQAALEPGTIGINLPIVPQQPLPRPRVMTRARAAVFEENKIGTPNIGIVGRDAKWSAYGEYLNKLAEAVESRWNNIIAEARTYPQAGTTVTVTFVINSEGHIASIVRQGSSPNNDLATGWCISAISPGPGFSYGQWPETMIAVLGQQQELTFTFLYR